MLEFSNENAYNYITLSSVNTTNNEKIKDCLTKEIKLNGYNNSNPFYLIKDEESTLDFYVENNKINLNQSIILKNKTKEDYIFSLSHGYLDYNPGWEKNRQGAYLMATDKETPDLYKLNIDESYLINGANITIINLSYEFSTIKIKIYHTLKEKKFTYDLETILHNYEPTNQKEFFLIVNSNIDNLSTKSNYTSKAEFWTDTNSMRCIKRTQDFRSNFSFNFDEEKLAGNVYPINSVVYISDKNIKNKNLYVFNDRSQGATSISKGDIYININRWSDRDDRRGLADGLYEYQSSRNHFVIKHVLAISKNFDNNNIYNFINKKPLNAIFFNFNDSKNKKRNLEKVTNLLQSTSTNQEVQNLSTNFNLIPKIKMNEIFKLSNRDCLETNYYFISEKKILVQFYNKSDPNLFEYSKCSVQFTKNLKFTISKYNLNGVDKENVILGKDFLKKRFFVSLDNLTEDLLFKEINVNAQEFETILIEFK